MRGKVIRKRSNGSNEFELKSVQVTSPTHARPLPITPTPNQYTTPRQNYNSKSQKYYCCVFISVFLIITGLILVVKSDVKRAKQAVVEPYENQIGKWNSKYKSEFMNVKWRLRISPKKYNGSNEQNSGQFSSENSTEQNVKNDDEQFLNRSITIPLQMQKFEKQVLEETDFYDQIIYKTKNSLFRILFMDKNGINQTTSNDTKNRNNIQINSQNKDEYIAITPKMQQVFQFQLEYKFNDEQIWAGINLGEIQIVKRKESKMASWKSCQFREGGRWFKGACITYKQIDQLCYIVAYHAKNKKYTLDKKYGAGAGCATGRSWLPYHLHRIRVSPRGVEVAKIPLQLINNPFFSVMHAHDPELYARNATHGTLIVAETNLETYAAGMTLLLFGSVLAFPLVILAAMWMVKKSTRHGKYQKFYNSDDDDDDDGSSDDY
eukprot:TRINITY_DN12330_c2_g1_i1.p1 TRINITY_DN12330_c2_g1~~TRINITY_DN12330_c2_g1_i1.p1  ORF type:complete len:434 (-),score=70.11 TRINITY_DN12330_c2_g1_i1:226-1527(-)